MVGRWLVDGGVDGKWIVDGWVEVQGRDFKKIFFLLEYSWFIILC